MDELSQVGRKLIDAAMEHDEPPPADESWGTLVSRLTEEAPRGALPIDPPVREEPRPRGAIKIAIVVAVVAAAGAAAWWWWWNQPEPVAVATTQPEPPAIAVAPAKTTPSESATPDEPPIERLLADAEAALAAGDPDRAMALLERHAERAAIHPQATQRMALRILVLCAQHQDDRARDEARAFLAAHAQSQWSDAVRRSCAGS